MRQREIRKFAVWEVIENILSSQQKIHFYSLLHFCRPHYPFYFVCDMWIERYRGGKRDKFEIFVNIANSLNWQLSRNSHIFENDPFLVTRLEAHFHFLPFSTPFLPHSSKIFDSFLLAFHVKSEKFLCVSFELDFKAENNLKTIWKREHKEHEFMHKWQGEHNTKK